MAVAAILALAALGPAGALGWGSREHFSHARDFGLRDATPPVIGKITSHTGNVVSIQLLDGTTASGMLTGDTTLLCIRHVHRSDLAHQSRDHRDRGLRAFERDFRGFDRWAHSSDLVIARCMAPDASPPRRVAGALLQTTTSGDVWRLLVVWD